MRTSSRLVTTGRRLTKCWGGGGDSSQSEAKDSDDEPDDGVVRGREGGTRWAHRRGGRACLNLVGQGKGNCPGRRRSGRRAGGRWRYGAHVYSDGAFEYSNEDDGGLNGMSQFTPNRTRCPSAFLMVSMPRVIVIFQAFFLLTLLTPKCSTPISMQLQTMQRNMPMWPGIKCTASLLCCSCKHTSIYFYQAKKPRRGTLSAAGTPIVGQRKCVLCCHTWESTCTPLDKMALQNTTITSRKSFVVSFCSLPSREHCTVIFTEFPTSPTTIAKIWKITNLTLVLVYILWLLKRNFLFVLHLSFPKMCGLLFAILHRFWVKVQ